LDGSAAKAALFFLERFLFASFAGSNHVDCRTLLAMTMVGAVHGGNQ
jgi:hypothetical protein